LRVEITDNSAAFLKELENAGPDILELIGLKAEGYAKKLCPVGTPESTRIPGYRGGTLRNSITHRVDGEVLSVGSNVHYAPYVELGTGPHFEPPPEWIQNDVERGRGVGASYVKPRPYIRPAIEQHKTEYEQIAKNELKKR
jgi:HK97 gp10 family phage protein